MAMSGAIGVGVTAAMKNVSRFSVPEGVHLFVLHFPIVALSATCHFPGRRGSHMHMPP